MDLSVDGGYGPRSFSTTAVEGEAVFTVPGAASPTSGTVLLEAVAGSQRTWSTIDVLAGDVTNPIDIFLGPRTIEAGSDQAVMAVAIPTDRFGNPTDDDVEFDSDRPVPAAASSPNVDTAIISFEEFPAPTEAGRVIVSGNAGQAAGPARTFKVVAGASESFELAIEGTLPLADGRSLVEIGTTPLVDRYGNPLPDGTLGELHVEFAGTQGRVTGHTIDSRISFVIEAPAEPGLVRVRGFASGGSSQALELDFLTAVSDLPTSTREDNGVTRLDVGPVTGPGGALVADGTMLTAEVDGTSYAAVLEQGVVSLAFADLPDANVTVLGTTVTVEVGR